MPRGRKATTTQENKEAQNTQENKTDNTMAEASQAAILEKFAKVVESQEKKIAELENFVKEAAKNKKTVGQIDPSVETTSLEKFSIDDVLETPKVYFTYSEEKTLYSFTDKKTRKVIDLPFGNENPIKFKKVYAYRKTSRDGKGEKVHKVARCVVWSKKEDEFIRNHPYYNVSIFESMKDAEDIDSTFATILESAKNSVSSISDHALVDRARQLGVDIMEDPSELRRAVIHKIAEKEMDAAKKRNAQSVIETSEARKIVENR